MRSIKNLLQTFKAPPVVLARGKIMSPLNYKKNVIFKSNINICSEWKKLSLPLESLDKFENNIARCVLWIPEDWLENGSIRIRRFNLLPTTNEGKVKSH